MAARRQKVTDTYPLELHTIRGLFLQKQYRECVQACRRVIDVSGDRIHDYPVQHTFLQLYQGLAYNELARAMHDQSQSKIPAFEQAEQYFQMALDVLPPPERSGVLVATAMPRVKHSVRVDSLQCLSTTSASSMDTTEQEFSPPAFKSRRRSRSFAVKSPSSNSSPRHNSSSDEDDLESHRSYDQIMTPSRLPRLSRSFSSMALLQTQPPPQQKLSHGLMKPIRLGSPAVPYKQAPANFSYPDRRSPPRFHRRATTSPTRPSPSNLKPLQIPPYKPASHLHNSSDSALGSPVSPLLYDDVDNNDDAKSDASTVSPISPETPANDFFEAHPPRKSVERLQIAETEVSPEEVSPEEEDNHNNNNNDEGGRETVVEDHLRALREQLHTHVALLQRSKMHTREAQAEWAKHQASMEKALTASASTSSSFPPSSSSARQDRDGAAAAAVGRQRSLGTGKKSKKDAKLSDNNNKENLCPVHPVRSFWAVPPPSGSRQASALLEKNNKRSRVDAGRARKWARKRFEPERYIELAQRAMAELQS